MPVLHVSHDDADRYTAMIRGHQLAIDQPVSDGGDDAGPAPVELFITSLASCVAFYAGRWLRRHGYPEDPLGVTAYWTLGGRPARVDQIRLVLTIPDEVGPERRAALLAVATHCTVHNTLVTPPDINVDFAEVGESAA
jgi:putative redox protein